MKLHGTKLNKDECFRNFNPVKTLDFTKCQDTKLYIDFSSVRGSNIKRELKRSIIYSGDEPKCLLFTGHVGCGKSTELSHLKKELEEEQFHVVYFESSKDLDMADVSISDILLAISLQVVKSLEKVQLKIQPARFQTLLKGAANLLNSEVNGLKVKIPQMGDIGFKTEQGQNTLSFGIGEITTKAKDSVKIRSLLRQYMEPRVNNILEAINQELIAPAQKQLKRRGKKGLVVIVDNLDRIDNKLMLGNRLQPEYLFVDRGEQLKQLQCHVVYTIPLILAFSNDRENLTNRFGSEPLLLPMIRVEEKNGNPCKKGIFLLRKMVLARAFPKIAPNDRLALIPQLFDNIATLNRLCQVSGGHTRNLLVLLSICFQKEDPPFSRNLVEKVIKQRRSDLAKAITSDEWELLKKVAKQKEVTGEQEYQTLLKSLFVFEYRDDEENWFGINPILAEAAKLK